MSNNVVFTPVGTLTVSDDHPDQLNVDPQMALNPGTYMLYVMSVPAEKRYRYNREFMNKPAAQHALEIASKIDWLHFYPADREDLKVWLSDNNRELVDASVTMAKSPLRPDILDHLMKMKVLEIVP